MVVFCTFSLGNVLRATTGVQFFSHLASWLRTRRFSRAYFSTIRSLKSLENHSVSRLSYLFAHLRLLSSDSFSSLIFSLLIFLFSLRLPCSAFHLSILSEVWLLNFLRICIDTWSTKKFLNSFGGFLFTTAMDKSLSHHRRTMSWKIMVSFLDRKLLGARGYEPGESLDAGWRPGNWNRNIGTHFAGTLVEPSLEPGWNLASCNLAPTLR